MTEIENFKSSLLLSLIEQAVNSKFEDIIAKHNSGGNLKDLDSEIHDKAHELIKEKISN